jgi:hypothetical protein
MMARFRRTLAHVSAQSTAEEHTIIINAIIIISLKTQKRNRRLTLIYCKW